MFAPNSMAIAAPSSAPSRSSKLAGGAFSGLAACEKTETVVSASAIKVQIVFLNKTIPPDGVIVSVNYTRYPLERMSLARLTT